ncbi:unnamed protein product [Prorocentrum cordatum]|uniref:Lipid-binding serum glycoprotein N-terminal domain-containing protein n=1 Tax=Prorocentrum cordatum TaxID=2364126 RepID=A0ABN9VXX8_9DINO|nr:unnamed protein product [Polarella glacialis]
MALRNMLQAGLVPVMALAGPSISSCGSPGDRMSNVTMSLSPDPIQKGDGFTITVSGMLDKVLDSFTVDAKLDVKLLGLINEKVDKTIPVKMSPGLAAGVQNLVIGPVALPTDVPGSAEVDGTVTLSDDAGKPVACVSLSMHVPAARALDDLQLQGSFKPADSFVTAASNCGKPTDHLKNIETSASGGVSTLTGTLDEDMSKVSVDVDLIVKALFVKVPLKLTVPIAYTPGIKQGALSVSAGPAKAASVLAAAAWSPTVQVAVTGTVQAIDGNSEEVACVKIDDSSYAEEEASLVV